MSLIVFFCFWSNRLCHHRHQEISFDFRLTSVQSTSCIDVFPLNFFVCHIFSLFLSSCFFKHCKKTWNHTKFLLERPSFFPFILLAFRRFQRDHSVLFHFWVFHSFLPGLFNPFVSGRLAFMCWILWYCPSLATHLVRVHVFLIAHTRLQFALFTERILVQAFQCMPKRNDKRRPVSSFFSYLKKGFLKAELVKPFWLKQPATEQKCSMSKVQLGHLVLAHLRIFLVLLKILTKRNV